MLPVGSHTLATVYSQIPRLFIYSRASRWHWENPIRLHKAATTSAIAATTWNGTDDIRVYFQDMDTVVREYCGSFSGGW